MWLLRLAAGRDCAPVEALARGGDRVLVALDPAPAAGRLVPDAARGLGLEARRDRMSHRAR
jgi:hypothetical protein